MQTITGCNLCDLHGHDLRKLLQLPLQFGALQENSPQRFAVDSKDRALSLRDGSRGRV